MFVPRRVLYELRAGREYFVSKERCVFCDIIQQEERQALRVIEARGDYLALCPYAPRVPYETWILPRNHDAAFERTGLNQARACAPIWPRSFAVRYSACAPSPRTFTSCCTPRPAASIPPRTLATGRRSTRTITGTSRFFPSSASKSRSYTFKEVYYSPVSSETAVKQLREAKIDG